MSYPGKKDIGSYTAKLIFLLLGLPGVGTVNGNRCPSCPIVPSTRLRNGSAKSTGPGLVQNRPKGASATSKNKFRSSRRCSKYHRPLECWFFLARQRLSLRFRH